MSTINNLELRITHLRQQTAERWPSHCRSCDGRGVSHYGEIDSFMGSEVVPFLCPDCSGENKDPFNTEIRLERDKIGRLISPTTKTEIAGGLENDPDLPPFQILDVEDMINQIESEIF